MVGGGTFPSFLILRGKTFAVILLRRKFALNFFYSTCQIIFISFKMFVLFFSFFPVNVVYYIDWCTTC